MSVWTGQPIFHQIRAAIEGIISTSNTATGSASLANGTGQIFFATTKNSANAKTLTAQDVTVYQDSVSTANAIPGGANITPGAWQIYIANDFDQTDNIDTVTRIYVYNVSAGTHTVIVKVKSRVIANTFTATTA